MSDSTAQSALLSAASHQTVEVMTPEAWDKASGLTTRTRL
jgi:hypothetical protein